MAASTVSVAWLVACALARGGLCDSAAPLPGPMLAAKFGSTLMQLDIRSESEKKIETIVEAPDNRNSSQHQGPWQLTTTMPGCKDFPLSASLGHAWGAFLGKTVSSCAVLTADDCKGLIALDESSLKDTCPLTCHACNAVALEARRPVPEKRTGGPYTISSCGRKYTGHIDSRYDKDQYSFWPPVSGTYTFSTCGSKFDTWVWIRDEAGNQIYSCDDCGNCGLRTVAVQNLTYGQTYTVEIGGYSKSHGMYTLSVDCPPTATANAAPPSLSSSTVAQATGDPHLQNMLGQKFDLRQPGKHLLLHIPRGAAPDGTLLRVTAKARQLGARCADMYFQEVNVTGAWVEIKQAGGFRFRADNVGCERASRKISVGKMDLKVVHGCTSQGARYINFYVRHLGSIGLAVGGLLGEDDHAAEETSSHECGYRVSL